MSIINHDTNRQNKRNNPDRVKDSMFSKDPMFSKESMFKNATPYSGYASSKEESSDNIK